MITIKLAGIRDFLVRRPVGWVLPSVALILFVRKGDALLNPQFWAEDGTVFFLQQYEEGAAAIFRGYAGYLHLIPRLLAWIADTLVPYHSIPAFYAYSCLGLTLWVATTILSSRLAINHRPALAFAMVLIPHFTNEVFLNLTNLQWILSLALIVCLMKEEPSEDFGPVLPQQIGDFLVVFLCGLTGPFIVLLLPFFLEKWARSRRLHNTMLLTAASLVSLIQLKFMVSTLRRLPGNSLDNETLSAILGHRVTGDLFLGAFHSREISHQFLSFGLLGLLVLLLTFAYRERKRWVVVSSGIAVIFLAATLTKFQHQGEILIPQGAAARYFYIPSLMLTWSIIMLWKGSSRWRTLLPAVALALVLVSSLRSHFRSPPFKDRHWETYSAHIGKEDIVIPINPKGWKITVVAEPD